MQNGNLPAQSAELLSVAPLPGNYTRLVLRVNQSMANLQPGHYCRIFNNSLSIQAPIMGVNNDVLECLHRICKTQRPVRLQPHAQLALTLESEAWNLGGGASHTVFLCQNEGLACIVHAAGRLHSGNSQNILTAFLEFDGSPPFTPKPSQILLPGAPAEAVACAPLLEDWGIASRMADPGDNSIPKPGWFSGTAVRLAEIWFKNNAVENCRLVCCGSQHFVEAVSKLADRLRLPVETTVLPG